MHANMKGFTYLGLLFAIVIFGIVLSVAGTVWHTQSKREKELELLFVGAQYRQAIESYRAIAVNGQRTLPKSMDELLDDRRFPMPVRHLRKRFRDPLTSSLEWGLIRQGDSIAGVFSLSKETPLKKVGFGACCADFESARTYADWKFSGADGAAAAPSSPPNPAATPNVQPAPAAVPASGANSALQGRP